ncbi:protein transporter [Cryptococcus deuterogattii LA55]|nr:protein transporter [Cryptococcus deuterogattii LA55]KIR95460.1 protein transporter [Cryptococcus deuterogattii CBS 10090]
MDEEQTFASLISSTTLPSRPTWDVPSTSPSQDADPWANPFSADTTTLPTAFSSPALPSSSPKRTTISPYVEQLEREASARPFPDPPSVIAAREQELVQKAEALAQQRNVYASSAFASPFESPAINAGPSENDPFGNPFAQSSSMAQGRDPASILFPPAPANGPLPPATSSQTEEQGKEILKNLIDDGLTEDGDSGRSLKRAFKKSAQVPREKREVESERSKAYVFSPKKKDSEEETKQKYLKDDMQADKVAKGVEELLLSGKNALEEDRKKEDLDQHQPQETSIDAPSPATPKANIRTPRSPTSVPLPISVVTTPVATRQSTPVPPTENLPIHAKEQTKAGKEKDEASSVTLSTPLSNRVSVSPLDAPSVEESYKNLSVGDPSPKQTHSSKSTWNTPQPEESQTPVSTTATRFGGRGWGSLDEDDNDGLFGKRTLGLTSGSVTGAMASWGEEEESGWGEPGLASLDGSTTLPSDDRSDEPTPSQPKLEPEPPYASSASSDSTTAPSLPTKRPALPYFEISVSDPTRVGDPVRGYTVYTIRTRTSSPHYRQSTFSCLRRFSDFLWLFEQLSHNNPGVIVPPMPDKHSWGRFEDQFVETRRLALERCLKKITSNPILQLDPDLRLFLESDNFAYESKERKHQIAVQTSSTEKGGLLAGWTGAKFVEQDEWFNSRRAFLEALESQLKSLGKAIEISSKHRVELAVSLADYAESLTALAESDLGASLSAALSQMSSLVARERDYAEWHAKSEVGELLNLADEYIRFIGSVRSAFAARVDSWKVWQEKDKEVARMKAVREKARVSGKLGDRVQSSLKEIMEVSVDMICSMLFAYIASAVG